jgi:DNA-binding NtrC family response regulator
MPRPDSGIEIVMLGCLLIRSCTLWGGEVTGKILIVDDDSVVRESYASILAQAGHDVQSADGYDAAMALLKASTLDLIFLDMRMPDRSGLDLLRDMRAQGIDSEVVIVTGFAEVDTATEAMKYGVTDYVPKPLQPKTLLRIARDKMRFRRLRQEKDRHRLTADAIVRSVEDGIVTVDTEMRLTSINHAATRICGLRNDLVGRPMEDLFKECGGKCYDLLKNQRKNLNPMHVTRVECPSGARAGIAPKVVSLNLTPLKGNGDRWMGSVLVIRDESRVADLERILGARKPILNMVGAHEKIQRVYSLVEIFSQLDASVLITGENGTGKGLVASALHREGPRKGRPFVKVNCSALSEGLLETELFGHVKGAFTGAMQDAAGRFETAHTGTIFLDEIGDISPRMQAKLLQVLQDKEFERVGSSKPVKVDVRVVSATNRDLRAMVNSEAFREDLYYRLKVLEIHVPPLRERADDIPLLADVFIKQYAAKLDRHVHAVSADVMELFRAYGWPGNVRELEHVIEYATALAEGDIIMRKHLPESFRMAQANGEDAPPEMDPGARERERLLNALTASKGNKSSAARMLGISRGTLYAKLREYEMDST